MFEVEDIGTLIQNAGLGTVGTDIFLYHAPADATNCIIVYPSNDPPPIDPERPFYMRAKFQTIVRHSNYQQGIALSKNLANTLTLHNTTTTMMKIKECRPLYQVRVYRRAESGEIEFSTTFQIVYVQN